MMRKSLAISAVLLTVFTGASADANSGKEFYLSVSEKVPPMRLIVLGQHETDQEVLIIKQGNKLLQEIHPTSALRECDTFLLDDPPFKYLEITTEDINFDGYADLKILCTIGRPTYLYWIFDEKRKHFDPKQEMHLAAPIVNTKKTEVREYENWGSAGLLFVERVHKWQNGKLILTRETTQTDTDTEDGKGYVNRVVKELRNGQLVTIQDEWLPLE